MVDVPPAFLCEVFAYFFSSCSNNTVLESSWNVMAHGDAREAKWRGNWRMEWVASTLHTTSELPVCSITTADAHTSAASSRLNWRPRRFKWTLPFRPKTKSGFCARSIIFQTQSTTECTNPVLSSIDYVHCTFTLQGLILQFAQHRQGTFPTIKAAFHCARLI